MREQLKPLIDGTYRTKTGAGTGIVGSTLGGLVSMYLGMTHAEIFTPVGHSHLVGHRNQGGHPREPGEDGGVHSDPWTATPARQSHINGSSPPRAVPSIKGWRARQSEESAHRPA
ncbi:alpha/beta hydrolase-fold protein [Melittangium boletus]|uniref:alpha/beta hydrolase-fold protein n=1 Tax=Melittangium boletus TaxID=83453 RepID=UPI003DA434F9